MQKPEPGRPWFFERISGAMIAVSVFEAGAERPWPALCGRWNFDQGERDSAGSASRFGPQTRLRMRFLLLLRSLSLGCPPQLAASSCFCTASTTNSGGSRIVFFTAH